MSKGWWIIVLVNWESLILMFIFWFCDWMFLIEGVRFDEIIGRVVKFKCIFNFVGLDRLLFYIFCVEVVFECYCIWGFENYSMYEFVCKWSVIFGWKR